MAKKLYWMQLPENKEKLSKAAKKGARNRRLNMNNKSRAEKAVMKTTRHYSKKVKIKEDYLKYLIDKLTERI